jgi:hypothetical protein
MDSFVANKNIGSGTKAVRWDPSRDTKLSYRAKGILYYLLLRDDNWQCMMSNLVNNSTESAYAVRKCIKELVDNGYMCRKHVRADGQFCGSYYEYSDKPIYKQQNQEGHANS